MEAQEPAGEPVPPKPRRGRRAAILIAALGVSALAVTGTLMWSQNIAASAAVAAAQQQEQAAASAKASADAAASAKASADVAAEEDRRLHDQAARDLSAAVAAKAEADRQVSVKSQMEAQGWTQFSGYLYSRYEDHSQYTCHVYTCTYLIVVSMSPNGCPGGIYVEASVESGGVSVGFANGMTASLPQGKPAVVKLQDTSQTGGDTIRLTTLDCHGG